MPRHAIEIHGHTNYVNKEYFEDKFNEESIKLQSKINYTLDKPSVVQLFTDINKLQKAYPITIASEVIMPDGNNLIDYLENNTNIPEIDLSNYYTKLETYRKEQVYNKSEIDTKLANISSGGTVDLSNYYNKQEVDEAIDTISLTPGPAGTPGKSIEYTWRETELGIRLNGQLEYTYVNLQGPKGDKGDDGEGGTGGQSREIEFRKGDLYIQWRYVGDTEWKNLIAISEITGDFDTSASYPVLNTLDKTILGAINENNTSIKNNERNVEILSQNLDGIIFKKITQEDYDDLVANDTVDENLTYVILNPKYDYDSLEDIIIRGGLF